ncbi:MAG: AmmeMemoRadiSam system protein B [Nanoarchaeota archaeon]|nr:AmmeMemoRadiSam system protein B [Nanoarchaeota archaeon]
MTNLQRSIRKPAVAGQFYSTDKEELENQIKEAFLSKFGPGKLPENKTADKKQKKQIRAAIVPHAGYMFSGPAAAHAYKAISESKLPDIFLILGTNHSSNNTCFCDQDYETPLGIAKTDREFVKFVSEKCDIPVNNLANKYEHSIEVQIPFLQFISKLNKKIEIATLLVSADKDLEKLGKAIAEAIKQYEKTGKKILIITSSDFTHFGFNYGYVPFMPGPESKEKLKELDSGAINFIKKKDSKGFLSYIEKTNATICGAMPIALLINIINNLYDKKENKVELLKYYTSSDIVNSFGSSVSYASIIFE